MLKLQSFINFFVDQARNNQRNRQKEQNLYALNLSVPAHKNHDLRFSKAFENAKIIVLYSK